MVEAHANDKNVVGPVANLFGERIVEILPRSMELF